MPSGDAFMSDSPAALDPKAIPAEIRLWNWGAFLLNWIWGIGNQTYIALLALIPGFGFSATGAGTASSISNACNAGGRFGGS
jgi:hypothetical protein